MDENLVDTIVCKVKSQGIFDQFRKECMSDVDTKPAYQNLKQRVETTVANFLSSQEWRPDLNKIQLREKLRKNIKEASFMDTGVQRIVDQVVNPKMNTTFHDQIEELVYTSLGLEKPKIRNEHQMNATFDALKMHANGMAPIGMLNIDTTASSMLMPTDLEAVSPDSVKSESQNEHDSGDERVDDFESPPFEPLDDVATVKEQEQKKREDELQKIKDEEEDKKVLEMIETETPVAAEEVVVKSENDDDADSQLSDISGLTSEASAESGVEEEDIKVEDVKCVAEISDSEIKVEDVKSVAEISDSEQKNKVELLQKLELEAVKHEAEIVRDVGASEIKIVEETKMEVEEDLSEVSSNSHLSIDMQQDETENTRTDANDDTSKDMVKLKPESALNISEEAQMPQFHENSTSSIHEAAGGQQSETNLVSNFDINKENIKFEGTERTPMSVDSSREECAQSLMQFNQENVVHQSGLHVSELTEAVSVSNFDTSDVVDTPKSDNNIKLDSITDDSKSNFGESLTSVETDDGRNSEVSLRNDDTLPDMSSLSSGEVTSDTKLEDEGDEKEIVEGDVKEIVAVDKTDVKEPELSGSLELESNDEKDSKTKVKAELQVKSELSPTVEIEPNHIPKNAATDIKDSNEDASKNHSNSDDKKKDEMLPVEPLPCQSIHIEEDIKNEIKPIILESLDDEVENGIAKDTLNSSNKKDDVKETTDSAVGIEKTPTELSVLIKNEEVVEGKTNEVKLETSIDIKSEEKTPNDLPTDTNAGEKSKEVITKSEDKKSSSSRSSSDRRGDYKSAGGRSSDRRSGSKSSYSDKRGDSKSSSSRRSDSKSSSQDKRDGSKSSSSKESSRDNFKSSSDLKHSSEKRDDSKSTSDRRGDSKSSHSSKSSSDKRSDYKSSSDRRNDSKSSSSKREDSKSSSDRRSDSKSSSDKLDDSKSPPDKLNDSKSSSSDKKDDSKTLDKRDDSKSSSDKGRSHESSSHRSSSSSKDKDKHRSSSSASSSSSSRKSSSSKDKDRDHSRKSSSSSSSRSSSQKPSENKNDNSKVPPKPDDHFSHKNDSKRTKSTDSNDDDNDKGSFTRGSLSSVGSLTSVESSSDSVTKGCTSGQSPSKEKTEQMDSTQFHLDDGVFIIPALMKPPIIVDDILTSNSDRKQLENLIECVRNNAPNSSELLEHAELLGKPTCPPKKKPKIASNIFEARKMSKIRKEIDRQEQKEREKTMVLAKKIIQNNHMIASHMNVSGGEGVELEFVCDQGAPTIINNNEHLKDSAEKMCPPSVPEDANGFYYFTNDDPALEYINSFLQHLSNKYGDELEDDDDPVLPKAVANKRKTSKSSENEANNNNSKQKKTKMDDILCNGGEGSVLSASTIMAEPVNGKIEHERRATPKAASQRYSCDDLYKPRPSLSSRSRRRGANLDVSNSDGVV